MLYALKEHKEHLKLLKTLSVLKKHFSNYIGLLDIETIDFKQEQLIDIDADGTPDEDNIRLTPAYQFAFASPGQRVYLVDEPVSWICDTVTGTLVRYTNYAITANHADRDSGGELLGAGASAALVADNVSACAVTYAPGTSQRSGLVTLAMSVADTGESVSLLHQVHVDNVP